MDNGLITTMADTETQDKLASVGSNSTVRETSEGQSNQDSHGEDGLTLYLIHHRDKEDQGVKTLDRAARNELFRKNPELIAATIAQTWRELAKQRGFYNYEDCTVVWNASFVPFHLAFSFLCPRGSCHHLVSVRNRCFQEPAHYAKTVLPLAKSFIEQSLGSDLPHLPFIRPTTPNGPSPEPGGEEDDEKIRRTMEQARFVVTKHGTLLEVDIPTAEATAKLVNAGKIDPVLLCFMTIKLTGTEPLPVSSGAEQLAAEEKQKSQVQGLVQPFRKVIDSHKLSSSAQQQTNGNKLVLNETSNEGKDSEQVKESILGEESVPTNAKSLELHLPKKRKKRSVKKKSQQESVAVEKFPQSEEHPLEEPELSPETSFPESSTDGRPLTTPPGTPLEAAIVKTTALTKTVSNDMTMDEEICTADHAKLIEPYNTSHTDELTVTNMSTQEISASCSTSSTSPSENRIEIIPACQSTAEGDAHVPENNLTEGRPQLILRTSFEVTTNQPQTASERTPISESFRYDSGYSSPTTDVKPTVSRRLQGLNWTYAMQSEADADLLQAGVWLWNKPRRYLQPFRLFDGWTSNHTTLPPVFVSHQSTGDAQPIIEYDGVRIHVVPHAIPWPDLRATPGHPDFLVPCKLVEYQASEAAGYCVLRHSRSYLYCRKTGCDRRVVDNNLSSCICPGCGPKTAIRYCSFQHLAEDVKDHWQECGHPDLAINSMIDHVQERSNSYREFPAIKEKHGVRSAARQLQQVFARHHKGHYTLFYPCSLKARTLSWPEADPKAKEMNARIERLLNIAFLDTDDYHVLSYLYRVLRHLLITAGEWDINTQSALNTQFSMEFDNGLLNTLTFSPRPPCECEWAGRHFEQYESHWAVCSLMPRNGFGSTSPVLGLEAYVERLENRYWILRASRQQHPTEEFWQRRAAGYGFSGLYPGLGTFSLVSLGPGWTGWGGREEDTCLPDDQS